MQIVSRASWGARPPKTTPRRIATPTPELWLHHTASPTGYEARVRAIQTFHMDTRGWNDIAYSYLVNHEGTVYEGRGAGIAGGHTQGHNTISHAICVMGHYDQTEPSVAAMRAVVELARYGHEQGWWRQGFTGGHRDASGASTSCPGQNLWEQIPNLNQAIELGDDMPSAREVADEVWLKTTIPDIELGGRTHMSDALKRAWTAAHKARVDSAVARSLAEQTAQGQVLTSEQINAIADAITAEVVEDVADELAERLKD